MLWHHFNACKARKMPDTGGRRQCVFTNRRLMEMIAITLIS